jgi:hypothetical protein
MTSDTEVEYFPNLVVKDILYKVKPKVQDDQSPVQTIYVNYKLDWRPLFLQTPPIEISCYGYTPQKYIKTEDDKYSLTLPIVDETFKNKLLEWNEVLDSNNFKNKIFDKAAKNYRLTPIIKINEEDETKLPKIKVRVDKNTNENRSKKTLIYNGLNEDNEITYDTIDEFQKHVSYRTTCVYILKVSRMWAKKLPGGDYGITFKIHKVFIIKSNSSSSSSSPITLNNKYLSDSIFQESQNMLSSSNEPNEKVISNSDSDSDDSDESDDSSQKSVKKSTVRCVEDSDEESDKEELKPKPKQKKK